MPQFLEQELEGWGRYPRSKGFSYRPESVSALLSILDPPERMHYIGRGLARSYGDAALNSGGGVILTDRLNRFLDFDSNGRITCESGVTLQEILQVALPRGWFLPVTPGTKFVTIGGAVACDIHGKNHHIDGSLSNFIESLTLLLADGRLLVCSDGQNTDLFWATTGGMGLTGIILEVTLRLRPVETSWIRVHYDRSENLEETLRLLEQEGDSYTYSVAWLDMLARGPSLGRSVLMRGNHCALAELEGETPRHPLHVAETGQLSVPVDLPGFVLNSFTIGCMNSLYYRRFKKGHSEALQHYNPFFYPLDSVGHWNRAYGKKGFIQYQCVLPEETAVQGMAELLARISRTGWGSFLSVLKRMGAETGLISFPMPGYTLALDLPWRGNALLGFLDELDEIVLRLGGRVYLAKDSRMSASTFRRMYPHLPEWLEIKRRVDPEKLFSSDLSRRLELDGGQG